MCIYMCGDVYVVMFILVHRISSLNVKSSKMECPGYLEIVKNPNSKCLKIQPLNVSEVGVILSQILNIPNPQDLPEGLAQLVLDVSSGNRHWCEEISHFVVERGVSDFLFTAKMHRESRSSTPGHKKYFLQNVVVRRMESLSPNHKVTLKYASMIGEEFNLSVLVRSA